MEYLEVAIEDPLIKAFLNRFSRKEWNEVIKETLKLGIHSMNTLQSLSVINGSPEKILKFGELEGALEDETTFVLPLDSLKNEGTTPSSKDGTKIFRNEAKEPLKKKKRGQLGNVKISRLTPKANRLEFDIFKGRKDVKRIHSLKDKHKNQAFNANGKDIENAYGLKKKCESIREQNAAKSFKSIKTKKLNLHLSPQNQKAKPIKTSLEINDFTDFYKNNMSCPNNNKVDIPLKLKKNTEGDPFMYITSSSEESIN